MVSRPVLNSPLHALGVPIVPQLIITMFTRQIVPAARVGTRAFSSTLRTQKTLTESAKETAQNVSYVV